MPITTVDRDTEALTMTIVADFAAPLERLWDAYTDPRQIERFWGPPSYPAQFTRHDAAPGGRSVYTMTGPEGEVYHGLWEWQSVQPRHFFEVNDRFAHADGTPNSELPTVRMRFTFEGTDEGSRVTTVSYFHSLDELEKLLEMGMDEGMTEAMGQVDAVLADLSSFAAGRATGTEILSDTKVRISRVIRGPIEDVWRAHTEAGLVRKWMLGPDGWTMPVCEVAINVGQRYRYEWEEAGNGGNRFGFEGELLEAAAPYRMVTTERMIGAPGDGTVNEMTLATVQGGTLMTLVITYPSVELRDMILGTGMADGMEASYRRLEREVLATAVA
ncbi:SRPBCC domain-containing protein [Hoyosella sp. G463]|uniref:SRPBCC domain-containing protein n=1 Tax=Lolliginicoccus lacisalsi TaxID=2742202 RepID=A0A927PN33_9ACTN|nr:SRPBCC family protein [Lolliginicoccus lacisalsi]MBD8507664.1 SRPBCC domain-containing protein [Lolliginicoccus lacisalsi]